ncbi:gamma-glutamylcyclotransferase family protein [Paracoccus sp. SCSIO 75233]|uniref:gamma-glutamylcyclotransferase family protein n=1 Tax=Paracoccus sp. SCSIO 75233 TaxID=3017782 RepID=UPI0022F0DD58|nr:gamma-glutamylcyclotransferase family protein [Paracoccus sp. SCSIO 75233]WBU54329.1 gamma-glutamylcyclotransferase [Paracoccus sp. SCSIO 75233]
MARYFAYGSNMLSSRLRARCASARVVGAAFADGYDVALDKIGRDGSGKATLTPGGAGAHGVAFELDDADLPLLDVIEGVGQGYDRRVVPIRCDGDQSGAFTYIAPERFRDAGLPPFDWYLALIVAGAREHGLPAEWIARLRAVAVVPDDMQDRPRRIEAEALLADCPADWKSG